MSKKNPKQLKNNHGGWEHTLVEIPDMGIAVRFGEVISRISDHCIPFFYHGCDGCLALRCSLQGWNINQQEVACAGPIQLLNLSARLSKRDTFDMHAIPVPGRWRSWRIPPQ